MHFTEREGKKKEFVIRLWSHEASNVIGSQDSRMNPLNSSISLQFADLDLPCMSTGHPPGQNSPSTTPRTHLIRAAPCSPRRTEDGEIKLPPVMEILKFALEMLTIGVGTFTSFATAVWEGPILGEALPRRGDIGRGALVTVADSWI